jgi:hypothetical protein
MKKKKIKFEPNTTVSISPESRALLERAHKDGLTVMYPDTLNFPDNDNQWKYFVLSGDEWCRSDVEHNGITIEELESMLYPKPQITFQDSIIELINQEIERVGIDNVTPLEKSLLKTLGIYPPKEVKVYDNLQVNFYKNYVIINGVKITDEQLQGISLAQGLFELTGLFESTD